MSDNDTFYEELNKECNCDNNCNYYNEQCNEEDQICKEE